VLLVSVDADLTRDPDLEQVWQHAGSVTAAGVQRLVTELQKYRSAVRHAFDFVDAQAARSQETTSIYRLRDHISAINIHLAQVQLELDLDHVDVADLS